MTSVTTSPAEGALGMRVGQRGVEPRPSNKSPVSLKRLIYGLSLTLQRFLINPFLKLKVFSGESGEVEPDTKLGLILFSLNWQRFPLVTITICVLS